jgi:hypothetical protein
VIVQPRLETSFVDRTSLVLGGPERLRVVLSSSSGTKGHAQRGACSETTRAPSDRVRAASADTARGGYAAAALARACCCSCDRCEQRSYWYLCYTFGGREAPDRRRC